MASADGALELKATDLDVEVVETVPAEIEAPGGTTVAAHLLYDIVRKLPEGAQAQLETQGGDGTLQLRAGRSRFALQALPETDFPNLNVGEFPNRFTLSSADLKRLIDKTQFAISTEETRYYLNGIYFHALNEGGRDILRAVATDGHRLAQVEMPAPQGAHGMPGVIVPRKAVSEVLRLVDDIGGDVIVDLSDSKIRFTFEKGGPDGEPAGQRLVLTSKLIDGAFPDYARVIPRANDKSLVVTRGDFTQAVDRVSTVSSERGRAVKLSLNDGRMVLTVTNPDSGSATEELPVDYSAAPLDIGFNSRYLLDIAAQLEGDTALFKLSDPGSPTLVQDKEGGSALYVLMPMRV
jgi:DNA polymerase-3 subunit beta